ncbi:gas vesicle protein GvpG [Amycolatopsis panacis]|uniref:Gas vesicle protein G n=1 Tax=Amycolatopsis panacis TaxID=2340917 RepID=A0A419I224_9PSEU|nr:gas vesicle protein GvpG [Amycolatopsis panacis]RJQ83842.1 gas vesicle protein G [Amycolatopsis panacis]
MGLLGSILGFPLAPVRGVFAIGELIQRRVDEELRSPASVRGELEALEQERAAGEISPGEEAEAQQQVLNRLSTDETR